MDIENAKLTNLTTDGFVKTSGGNGSLTVDTAGGGTTIKSIQRGIINITSGNTSNTATITSVTTGKSVINHCGSQRQSYPGSLTLTNATTVTAEAVDSGDTRSISFEVLEFN